MAYIKSAALEETGYVVLDPYGKEIDPKEWMDLEYVDWKSSGDTRFAPLASASARNCTKSAMPAPSMYPARSSSMRREPRA